MSSGRPLQGLKLLLHDSVTQSMSTEQLQSLRCQLLNGLGAARVFTALRLGAPQQVRYSSPSDRNDASALYSPSLVEPVR